MATYVPAKRATAYIFYAGLPSQAASTAFQSTPTLAAGDFKVSIDGGALANLATLPTNTPASSKMVKFSLSGAEMTGDNITIICSDAAGAEWCDVVFNIQTAARQIDDLAYPATSGRSMVVDAAGLVDANTVKIGPTGAGTAQTARDIGTSVLLSSGTGTGQLDFTSGVVKANLVQILGTALTETAGLLAGGFKKFFNVATPTGTLNSIPDAVPDAAGGLPVTGVRLTAIPTIAAVTTVTTVSGNVGGNVTGSVGSLATQAKADVNTEVLDVLNTDTFAEPGQGPPAATASLVAKIGYLYKFLRNKVTQTSTIFSVYNDAGSVVDQKAAVSDDGSTFTRAEIETGP